MTDATKHAIDRSALRLAPPIAIRLTSSIWVRRSILLVIGLTIAHGIFAAGTGLSDTEAYYVGWARRPALSYYDHPPLIAWTTWLIAGSSASLDDAAIVRLGPVLYAAVFSALLYRLAARLFSPRAGFYAVSIVSVIPVFFFTGFLVNPEALLAPLWTLFLLLLLDLAVHDEPWRPVALGAVVGVAFLAKYTAVLALPVTLIYLAGTVETRRWLRRPSFYAGGLVALAIALPVIVWNRLRGWPSLHLHLSERMAGGPQESGAAALWRVAKGQIAYFQPVLLPALLGVLGYVFVRSKDDRRYRFLLSASLPVLAFLLTAMVRASDSEPHWTMMGYMPLAVAAAGLLDEADGVLGRVVHATYRWALGFSFAAASLYIVHLQSPRIARALPHYDAAADPINETVGWDRVRSAVAAHATALGSVSVVVAAHNVLCGHLQVAIDDSPPVYCASPRRTQFDFVGRRSPPAESPVVLVDSERYPADIPSAMRGYQCAAPDTIDVERLGLHAARYRLHDCLPVRGHAR
jgi:4-amino-4-deoxy-L-arabinose transferase-like glycosyltransferase